MAREKIGRCVLDHRRVDREEHGCGGIAVPCREQEGFFGIKRHIAADTQGLLHVDAVTAVDLTD